jgi:hypothetical protein
MKVFVARGRTVMADGQTHGPGEVIELKPDEAAHLTKLGFVQSEPPILYAPQAENRAGVGHQHTQGPTFRR